jgi:hypothetical protein
MQVLKTSGFIEVHGASPDRPFRGGRGQESTDDLKLCRVAASFNQVVNGTQTTLRSVGAHYHWRYTQSSIEEKSWQEGLT